MSILLVQDGMCVQFVTREPLYRDMGLVPHSWDVRADWRADTPRCSAIQTRGYARLDDFLVWFFNLPPRSDQLPAATDRPPEATLDATWSGYVLGDGAGPLRLELGPDMDSEIAIDGVAIDPAAARGGVTLTTGARELQIGSRLSADRWRMTALWNDRDLFSTSRALVSSPSALDLAIRPVGYLVTSAAAITLIGGWTISFIRRTASVALFGWALVTALATVVAVELGGDTLARWMPLVGRGLSEISSAGFIYGAAICAFAARHGSPLAILGAGVCATLAFYTRLNNLPISLATAACAFASSVPAHALWRFQRGVHLASRATLAGVLGGLFVALNLFSLRTWYYPGQYHPLHGTQAAALSVWAPLHDRPSATLLERMAESVLMVVTMSDPPRLDVRALPLLIGTAAAVLAMLGMHRFRWFPASAVCLCIAGLAGALVARGNAYAGRFSVHMIPAAVALTVCASAMWSPDVPRRGAAGGGIGTVDN